MGASHRRVLPKAKVTFAAFKFEADVMLRVPTIQSYYKAPPSLPVESTNKGWQTVRDPPSVMAQRPKKPLKNTPRRVVASSKLSTVPRVSKTTPRRLVEVPSSPKRTRSPMGSPRCSSKTASPYAKKL